MSKTTQLAKALTQPQAEAIVKRALKEATVLWDKKFVPFFMKRLWPKPQWADDGLMERLEDLERRVEALEQQT